MNNRSRQPAITVDHLIDAIVRKLEANRTVLEKSIHYGRISWRLVKNAGEIEVELEPKL